MKVSVFGPSGMLGRQVVKQLREQGHEPRPVYRRMFELLSRDSIARSVDGSDAAINCAGVIPIRSTDIVEMIRVNSEFPHLLAGTGLDKVVLVSTDCVFSGRGTRPYSTKNSPDPKDYYGRSKVLGEVSSPNCCVVRTSFIGCEHGFMHWIMAAGQGYGDVKVQIKGYKNALWTGSTVTEVAYGLVALLGQDAGWSPGIVHMATQQIINKYDLAVKIVEMKGLNVEVSPVYDPVVNRALEPSNIEACRLVDIDTALDRYACSGAVG